MSEQNLHMPFMRTAVRGRSRWLWMSCLLGGLALVCLWLLEARFAGIEREELRVGDTPVTLYRAKGADALPLAVVAHGFGGSRQMMDQISLTLARAGFAVAAFDFPGHGRHPGLLSADVTRVEGTTMQLVAQTLAVTEAMRARADIGPGVSFVGHSMATDVVIRAARDVQGVRSVAALSMYSPAVTARHPERLLIVSGATEGHLRSAALDALRLVTPNAQEGETVTAGHVARRVDVAPFVGHVGVLYAERTLAQLTSWMAPEQMGTRPDMTGWIAGMLMVTLALLPWPLSHLFAERTSTPRPVAVQTFWTAVLTPVLPAIGAGAAVSFGVIGVAGFATLAAIFAIFGLVQLAVLLRAGHRAHLDVFGTGLFLVWGLGVFALALDRYGASFLPTGPRGAMMALMALGTVPLMLADRLLLAGARWWQRGVARFAVLLTLSGAMALSPTELGLTFTVLPVYVLFVAVYGALAYWIEARRGAGGLGLGAGVALAWAIAASTPLFAAGGVG
ncbi:alpha/beta fold hydrolase [Roseobacteraceae bacterium S113]